jgi:hypothetical protein
MYCTVGLYNTAISRYFITMFGAIQTHLHKNTAMQRFLIFFPDCLNCARKKEAERGKCTTKGTKLSEWKWGGGGLMERQYLKLFL